MAYSYNLDSADAATQAVARVRLLIPDNRIAYTEDDPPGVADAQPDLVFTDEEIGGFLAIENNSVHMAAAQALDTIASDMAILYKHIEVMDVVVDAASTAKALYKQADMLRRQGTAKMEFSVLGFDDIDRSSNAAQ